MKKRIVVAAVLAVLMAASAYAQTKDFFELAKTGTPQQVQAAIDKGADVKAQDKSGRTALIWAATNNQNPEVITTLLKAGADIKAQDKDGRTGLMWAARYNKVNPEVFIMALLNVGADAKAKDKAGKTALDYAKDNENLQGTDALKKLEEASK